MTVAMPIFEGRISPVLDVAARLLVIRDRQRSEVILANADPLKLARQVVELKIDHLICGAISSPLKLALTQSGVKVTSEICGPVETVLEAFLNGNLMEGKFLMPGCCRRRKGNRSKCCRFDRLQ